MIRWSISNRIDRKMMTKLYGVSASSSTLSPIDQRHRYNGKENTTATTIKSTTTTATYTTTTTKVAMAAAATAAATATATATETSTRKTTATTTTPNANCNLFSERQRKQSRDNLLNNDFYKFILLIWLVINHNVSVVLSADNNNNNNFTTNYFELNAINSNRYGNNAVATSANKTNLYGERSGSADGNGIDYTEHVIISDDDIEQENDFTATWAVHVPGGKDEANRVAAEHGFNILGEVSAIFVSISIFSFLFCFFFCVCDSVLF